MRRANKVFNVLMAAILSLSLMPAGSAFAADNGTGSSGTAAKPANVSVSNQIIILDGKEINTQGYSIDGSIYFKLRDAAELLKGTSVQFSVDFDEKSFQVRTKAGEAYSGSASVTEGTKADKPFSCSISKWALLVNGTQVGASIYNIDKSNYIRLSDLGALFGFGVKYDEMTKTTTLDTKAGYSLNISDYSNMWTYNADSNSYSLTGVTYCSDPAAAAYESLNIYVPAAYMNANGSITSKVINGYTAGTAPIIYSNGVGGYSQATAEALNKNSRSYNSFCTYLKNGYVVVSAGSRGKQTQASDGSFIGKSPAGLVDLKAGVRFLKYNDALLAGDSKKIVSIGTSAGGALSSLLGTTGNSPDYDSYLKEIGAVMTEGDDVYGAQCYCPITDLDNADMAYEWMYQGQSDYSFMGNSGKLTAFQQALSADLAAEFPGYVNQLGLDPEKDGTVLKLDKDSSGSYYSGTYYNYLISVLEDSLAGYLTETYSKDSGGMSSYTYLDTASADAYLAELNKDPAGKALKKPWVSVSYATRSASTGPNQTTDYKVVGKVAITSLADFTAYYRTRGKMCTAFDDLTLGQAENQEFGSASVDTTHFDKVTASLISKNSAKYAATAATEGSKYNYSEALLDSYAVANSEATADRVALLNPMNYIGNPAKACDTAPYFRIRVGTKDEHTSFTVAMNLALALETKTKATVDYAMVWNQGHGDADFEGDLVAWIERICKTEVKYSGEQIAAILNLANSSEHSWEYDKTANCYKLGPVVDVASPELPDYEGIAITVPAAYMNSNGTINYKGTVNGYTAATAPIVVNTGAAGYSSSRTRTAGTDYLDNGYINVEVGNRGKQSSAVNAKGESYFCGDSPYCLVDQKAAVRWLKYNIALGNVPGSADRIVTKGGSGGGSHAIMMAATGNNSDFYPYLEKSGAIMSYTASNGSEVKISDAVFGCDPLSPITSLEESNIAYEWEWSQASDDKVNTDYLTAFRKILSGAMSEEYIGYINGLGLKDSGGKALTINKDGKSGTYIDYFSKQLKVSLDWYLNNLDKDTMTWFLKDGESYAEAYIKGDYYKAAAMMGPPGGGFADGNNAAPGMTGAPSDMTGAPAGMTGAPAGMTGAPSGAPTGAPSGAPTGAPGSTATATSTAAAATEPNGTDKSSWITIKKDAAGKWSSEFTIGDFLNYANRSKNNPAFDDLDLGQAENAEFGDYNQDTRHWDTYVLKAMTTKYKELKAAYGKDTSKYADFEALYAAYKTDVEEVQAGDGFGNNIVELYNPVRYIMDAGTELPRHVRIVTGSKDTDTSLTVSLNCYLEFVMMGVDTTLGWSWDEGHCGAAPLNTSFEAWLDAICKK